MNAVCLWSKSNIFRNVLRYAITFSVKLRTAIRVVALSLQPLSTSNSQQLLISRSGNTHFLLVNGCQCVESRPVWLKPQLIFQIGKHVCCLNLSPSWNLSVFFSLLVLPPYHIVLCRWHWQRYWHRYLLGMNGWSAEIFNLVRIQDILK